MLIAKLLLDQGFGTLLGRAGFAAGVRRNKAAALTKFLLDNNSGAVPINLVLLTFTRSDALIAYQPIAYATLGSFPITHIDLGIL